jgi:phosphoglycerate dehydrogenase-like enzyme
MRRNLLHKYSGCVLSSDCILRTPRQKTLASEQTRFPMPAEHSPPPQHPLTILVSQQAADTFGKQIADLLAERPYRLITLDQPPNPDGSYDTDIAFLSRDVTGNSGKTQLAPTLLRFYEIIRASPRLSLIQMSASGADRPIYAEMRARGVQVCTSTGANSGPVAQMALTGLLMLARRMPDLLDSQRRHAWEPLLGPRAPVDLKNQTALVVGLGAIGREIARLLRAIGMPVLGVRRGSEQEPAVDETFSFETIDLALPRADWVVLACPLTALSRDLLNARRIALLPPGARVINIARGEVLNEQDLIAALRSGQIGGAYLDVLQSEPLPAESPLWAMPRVIITPHTAGHTAGMYAAVGEIFLDNLRRFRDGDPLRNPLD